MCERTDEPSLARRAYSNIFFRSLDLYFLHLLVDKPEDVSNEWVEYVLEIFPIFRS